jgi:hypothetical protein
MDKPTREEAFLVVQETNIGGAHQIFDTREEAEYAATRRLDNEYAMLVIPVTRFSAHSGEAD